METPTLEQCHNCTYWVEHDYCAFKPLYTSTDRNHVCDEIDIIGRSQFADKHRSKYGN